MNIDPRLQQPFCPWCKSADKAVSLDVIGMNMHCYNDWHLPACKNCGQGRYSHGHEFGCQDYFPDHDREFEALLAAVEASQKALRATRDTTAIRSSTLGTQMLMTAIGKP